MSRTVRQDCVDVPRAYLDHGDASASTAADTCPLSGMNRTPWVHRGIDAIDLGAMGSTVFRSNHIAEPETAGHAARPRALVALNDGKVTGGDTVLAYTGSYVVDGDKFTAFIATTTG
jgi:hypothetical protein